MHTPYGKSFFARFSKLTAQVAGHPITFLAAGLIILAGIR